MTGPRSIKQPDGPGGVEDGLIITVAGGHEGLAGEGLEQIRAVDAEQGVLHLFLEAGCERRENKDAG